MTGAEIIPTIGHIEQVTPPEADRSDADHFSLIRGVLLRASAQAVEGHASQRLSFAAVEEVQAALASLRHLESGGQSTN